MFSKRFVFLFKNIWLSLSSSKQCHSVTAHFNKNCEHSKPRDRFRSRLVTSKQSLFQKMSKNRAHGILNEKCILFQITCQSSRASLVLVLLFLFLQQRCLLVQVSLDAYGFFTIVLSFWSKKLFGIICFYERKLIFCASLTIFCVLTESGR